MYPEYPPRVRIEWLTATARVVLAVGALLAGAIAPFSQAPHRIITYALAAYLVYSLVVVALVWTPVKFARGWAVSLHLFDLTAFSLFTFLSEGTTSPFFIFFVFLVICGTLRWELRGTALTAAAAIAVYVCMSLYAIQALNLPVFALETVAIRSVQLAVVAVLLGCLAAYQRRFHEEISRVVSWPRQVPRDAHHLIADILSRSAEILEAPRILLVWEEPDDAQVNLAWRSGEELVWACEPEGSYGSLVVPGLENKSFQAADVRKENGRVVHWSGGSFRHRACRPINPGLQERFHMAAVQSWSLDGELIRGRLFCLDKRQMRLDDLMLGEIVARLAVSQLDSLYLLRRLRQAAALEERLRVARDLHDSILQAVAGTALQLVAARRLIDRDPQAARERLEDVQSQLEHGELEMRSFIRRLRPPAPAAADRSQASLGDRLDELARRVERQWGLRVKIRFEGSEQVLPDGLVDEVYRIAQEGILNAARHADASKVVIDLTVSAGRVHVRIIDDGRGFPFTGTYDLATLNAMNAGPLTLKERVAELSGDLELRSTETGTDLVISLPLAQALASM